jgi:hypothetical protein
MAGIPITGKFYPNGSFDIADSNDVANNSDISGSSVSDALNNINQRIHSYINDIPTLKDLPALEVIEGCTYPVLDRSDPSGVRRVFFYIYNAGSDELDDNINSITPTNVGSGRFMLVNRAETVILVDRDLSLDQTYRNCTLLIDTVNNAVNLTLMRFGDFAKGDYLRICRTGDTSNRAFIISADVRIKGVSDFEIQPFYSCRIIPAIDVNANEIWEIVSETNPYFWGIITANQILTTDSNNYIQGISTLQISQGGTNSTTALTNNKVMVSTSGAIKETPYFAAIQDGSASKQKMQITAAPYLTINKTSHLATDNINDLTQLYSTAQRYEQWVDGLNRLSIEGNGVIRTQTANYDTLISNDQDLVNKKYGDDNWGSSAVNTFDAKQFHVESGNVTLQNFPDIEYTIGSAESVAAFKCQYGSLTDAIAALPASGMVNSASIASAGSGYVGSELLTVNGGNSQCFVLVTSVGGSGEVTGIDLQPALSAGYISGMAATTPLGGGSGLVLNITTYLPLLKCHPDYNDIAGSVTLAQLSTLKATYLFSSVENSALFSQVSKIDVDTFDLTNFSIFLDGINNSLRGKYISKNTYLSTGYDTAIVCGSSSTVAGSTIKVDSMQVGDVYNGIDCIAGEINIIGGYFAIENGRAIGHPTTTYTASNQIRVHDCEFVQGGANNNIYMIDSGNSFSRREFYGCKFKGLNVSPTSYAFYMRGGTTIVYGGTIEGVTAICNGTAGTLILVGCKLIGTISRAIPSGVTLRIIEEDRMLGDYAVTGNITATNVTTTNFVNAYGGIRAYEGNLIAEEGHCMPHLLDVFRNASTTPIVVYISGFFGDIHVICRYYNSGTSLYACVYGYFRIENLNGAPTIAPLNDTGAFATNSLFSNTKNNANHYNIFFDTDLQLYFQNSTIRGTNVVINACSTYQIAF